MKLLLGLKSVPFLWFSTVQRSIIRLRKSLENNQFDPTGTIAFTSSIDRFVPLSKFFKTVASLSF